MVLGDPCEKGCSMPRGVVTHRLRTTDLVKNLESFQWITKIKVSILQDFGCPQIEFFTTKKRPQWSWWGRGQSKKTDSSLKAAMYLTHIPAPSSLRESRTSFSLVTFTHGRDPLSLSHSLVWRAGITRCLPRTLSTSDQKLGDPVTSDPHVVSDLRERTPEEWVRYSFADLSHGHENQYKNTENIQFSLAVTCSGQVRPLWS